MQPFWTKLNTKEFENKLLGMIRIGKHVSVSDLALAMGCSKLTVTKQLYRWAEKQLHLSDLRRVNWAWNRHGRVPESYKDGYSARAGAPKSFSRCVIKELVVQIKREDLVKVEALTNLLEAYSV